MGREGVEGLKPPQGHGLDPASRDRATETKVCGIFCPTQYHDRYPWGIVGKGPPNTVALR